MKTITKLKAKHAKYRPIAERIIKYTLENSMNEKNPKKTK